MSRWVKGQSGNPRGRPKRPELEELRKALDEAKKKHGNKSILQHFVEQGYEDKAVLIALVKKLIPDKVSAELDEGDGQVTINVLRISSDQTALNPVSCKQIESKLVDNAITGQLRALPKVIEGNTENVTR